MFEIHRRVLWVQLCKNFNVLFHKYQQLFENSRNLTEREKTAIVIAIVINSKKFCCRNAVLHHGKDFRKTTSHSKFVLFDFVKNDEY